MYQVICKFADLLDNLHVYEEGVEYPRVGYSPSSDRIEELSTNRNKAHQPLIVFIPDKVVQEPEPVVQVVVQESGTVVQEPEKVAEEKPAKGRKRVKNVNNAN